MICRGPLSWYPPPPPPPGRRALTRDLLLFGELHLVAPLEPIQLESQTGQRRLRRAALGQLRQRLLQSGADQFRQLLLGVTERWGPLAQ